MKEHQNDIDWKVDAVLVFEGGKEQERTDIRTLARSAGWICEQLHITVFPLLHQQTNRAEARLDTA